MQTEFRRPGPQESLSWPATPEPALRKEYLIYAADAAAILYVIVRLALRYFFPREAL